MFCVYVHIAPNKKLYIGITKQGIYRWGTDGKGYAGNRLFWRAIQKYGWDNFKHIILLDGISKEIACECEKYLIVKFQSNNAKYGYNIASGGEYNSGFHFHHTEQTKIRIGNASRGHVTTEQQKQAISNALKGRIVSKESRLKISKTISSMMNDDYKNRISKSVENRWKHGNYKNRKSTSHQAWNKGLTKEDERVAKYCRKKGEFHQTEEARRKMSASKKGKPAHNRKKVLCVETGIIYECVSYAQKATGINNISIAARNQNRTAGTFHWRYVNE